MVKHLKNFFLLLVILFIALLSYFVNQYLTFDALEISFSTTSTKVLDKNGDLLYEISENNAVRNTPITYNEVPQNCVNSIVAVEDKTFWNNIGIDLNGTLRLGLTFVSVGKYRGGGSTISQQVIKLSDQKIYGRSIFDKFKEMSRSVKLNQEYSKEEILMMYLNNAYMGNLNYGIESASQDFLGKSATELDLAECSYLMGLPQAPSIYYPYGDLEQGLLRQNIVLTALLNEGYISNSEFQATSNEELNFRENEFAIKAPHFVQFLQDNLNIKNAQDGVKFVSLDNDLETLNWNESYSIKTYYDYELHQNLQNLLKTEKKNANNAAAIVLGSSGELLTMIGSVDFFDDDINGKFNSSLGFRQPAQIYNPFIYAFSLESGLTLETSLENKGIFKPVKVGKEMNEQVVLIQNQEKEIQALNIDLGTAIENNLDIPAVHVLEDFGAINFADFLQNLPISQISKDNLESFANYCNEIANFEGCEINLLDLVLSYQLLRNNGENSNFQIIKTVEDMGNNLIYENEDDNQFEYDVNEDLENIFSEINSNLKKDRDWVVNYGIARNSKDLFIIGFNAEIAFGVWIGNTDGTEIQNISEINLQQITDTILNNYL